MKRCSFLILGTFIAALAVASAAPGQRTHARIGDRRTVARFFSPTRNLGCEVRPSSVFCQSMMRPHSVRMGATGRYAVCRGLRCVGNAPEGTPILRYGRQITLGRFRCTSLRQGVRCIVIDIGRGFLIDRVTVRRVGR
jgi:hypothetical protein